MAAPADGVLCFEAICAIDGGIEVWIVVHFELAIELEAKGSGQDGGPDAVKRADEVALLLFEDSEAFAVAFDVAGGGVCTFDLLGGVEDFEREDGEPVDHEAGALRVQRRVAGGKILGGERLEQEEVTGFGEVVAALVDAVDGALDGGNLGVCGVGQAGLILGVPEFEISGVLLGDGAEPGIFFRDDEAFGLVPATGAGVLEGGDIAGGYGAWGDHCPLC